VKPPARAAHLLVGLWLITATLSAVVQESGACCRTPRGGSKDQLKQTVRQAADDFREIISRTTLRDQ